jgi:WD40 repeat protein
MEHSGGRLVSIGASEDGRRAISGAENVQNAVCIWDLETGEHTNFAGGIGATNYVAMTPNGRHAMTACERSVKWLDLPERTTRILELGDWIHAVAFAAGGELGFARLDDCIVVMDAKTNTEIRSIPTLRHVEAWAFAVSSDGKFALHGCTDGRILLQELETGENVRQWRGHSNLIKSVAFSADGKRAVSASYDKTLTLWDIDSEKALASFSGDISLSACAMSPNGLSAAAGDWNGRVHLVRLAGNSEP